MFIFALGLTMWAYNVSSDCESFWKMLVISLSRESQQCQYAHYRAPIGVIFMLLGGLVGVGGASMKDEDRMNLCNSRLNQMWAVNISNTQGFGTENKR
jgi:hypothetical protein